MKLRARCSLSLERLEDRSVPSVTANVTDGNLTIVGDPNAASNITITAADTNGDHIADSFTVMDGGTTVGTFTGVTNALKLKLTSNNDTVSIDLGGLSTPGRVRADLGDGTNMFTIADGTVKGSLTVKGGNGTDAVTVGGGTGTLTVNGNTAISLDGGDTDSFELKSNATLMGNLQAFFADTVLLDAGSVVDKNVIVLGGSGGSMVTLAGTVHHNAIVLAAPFGSTTGTTLNVTGTVDGSVIFKGSKQADTLNVTGTIGKNLIADLGAGDDTATIGGTINGNLILLGGKGNDSLTISGTVGKHTVVDAGKGNDHVTITATAKLMGKAKVKLGKGDDTLTLDDMASITKLVANGGAGTDTFVGNKTRAGLKLEGFEN
jgi:hypothetical protein